MCGFLCFSLRNTLNVTQSRSSVRLFFKDLWDRSFSMSMGGLVGFRGGGHEKKNGTKGGGGGLPKKIE